MPITVSVLAPEENHENPWNELSPSFTSVLLRIPYCWSKIHWNTVVVARMGVAHASTSVTWSATRTGLDRWRMSNAISMPVTTVPAATDAMKTTVRRVMVQNSGSERIAV